MEHGRLGKAWQCLVDALDHHVGPLVYGAVGEAVSEAEMGPVGLVHDQHPAVAMGHVGDGLYVAAHAVVGGAGEDHRLRLGVVFQRLLHVLGVDGPADAVSRIAGQHVHRGQGVEHQGVVDGDVAVPPDDDGAPRLHAGAHRRQNAAGAAVDQKEGPPAAPQGGGTIHGIAQDAPGVVEIVKAVDLRDVPGGAQILEVGRQSDVALVARHVHGGGGVVLQFSEQTLVHR